MRGEHITRPHAGVGTQKRLRVPKRAAVPERAETPRPAGRRPARKAQNSGVYARRRMLAVSVVLLGVLVLVFAAFAQTSGAGGESFPIDPNNAGPDAVLAEVAEVGISSPIRPEEVTGLGYHPEGESLVEMSHAGRPSATLCRALPTTHCPDNTVPPHDPASASGADGSARLGAELARRSMLGYRDVTAIARPALQEDASRVDKRPKPDIRSPSPSFRANSR